jgi:hypothetical protein
MKFTGEWYAQYYSHPEQIAEFTMTQIQDFTALIRERLPTSFAGWDKL